MKVRFCLDCADVAAQVSWLRQRLRQRQRQRQRVATWLMKMLLKCDTLRCLTVLATPTCCVEGGVRCCCFNLQIEWAAFCVVAVVVVSAPLILLLLGSFFYFVGFALWAKCEDKTRRQEDTTICDPSVTPFSIYSLPLPPFLLAYLLLALIKQRCCCCCCCCRKFFGGNLPTNKQE